MNNPHVTFSDAHGKRIYSIETPVGFVHVVADQLFEFESDAMRFVKGRVNPVVEAMVQESQEPEGE